MNENIQQNTMTVVVVEPGKYAREAVIQKDLHSLQEVVGGYIEAVYPFRDTACIVCNDEGKITGLAPNRCLRDETSGEIYDQLCGTFFICGLGEDSFISLTPEQVKKYKTQFYHPELFLSVNGGLLAIPYDPEEE